MTMLEIFTHSAEETRKIGVYFSVCLRLYNTVALIGELGSGKTVFVRGAASGLGYAGPVTSPTFTLVHEYKGASTIYHIDCFRLLTRREYQSSSIEDYLESDGIVFAEWGNRIADHFDNWCWEIKFDFINGEEDVRKITFSFGRNSQSIPRSEKLNKIFFSFMETTS